VAGTDTSAWQHGYVKAKGQVSDEDRGEPGKGAIRTARRRGGGDDDSDSVVEIEEMVCNELGFVP